ASAAWDGTVRLWSASTGRQIRSFRHDEAIVLAVAFSPDGRKLMATVRGNHVYVWDVATGARLHKHSGSPALVDVKSLFDPYFDARAVANRQGTLLAAGDARCSARLWDLASGQPVAEFGKGTGSSHDVAFHPEGNQLATAERDGTVRVWKVPGGELLGELRGH